MRSITAHSQLWRLLRQPNSGFKFGGLKRRIVYFIAALTAFMRRGRGEQVVWFCFRITF